MTTEKKPSRRAGDLDPDPEMWAALGEGAMLRQILEDFYTRVYDDSRLSSFFGKVTKQRAVDKQYEFLRDKYLGTRDYFGDRPRNAHHWMVISDELFDYREDLLAACARDAGLPERFVQKWRDLDERFRKQIVKAEAFPKKVRGRELPLEGYEKLELSVGSMCDACEGELPVGATAVYHVRTGETRCLTCAPADEIK